MAWLRRFYTNSRRNALEASVGEKEQFAREKALPDQSVQPFISGVMEARAALTELTKVSEGEFLAIGSHLERFCTISGAIRTTVEEIASAVDEVHSRTSAHELLRRASTLADTAIAGLQSVTTVLTRLPAEIGVLLRHQHDLCRTVSPLRVISTQFRVQAVSASDETKEVFVVLSEEVTRIALDIERSVEFHRAELRQTCNTLEKLGQHLSKASADHACAVNEPMATAQRCIEEWETSLSSAIRGNANLKEKGGMIGGVISRTTMALQMQDIVRQEIEHMDHALSGLEEELNAVLGVQNADAAESSMFRYISVLAGIEQRQSELVIGKLSEAHATIDAALQCFRTGAMELSDGVKEVAQVTLDRKIIEGALRSTHDLLRIAEATVELTSAVRETILPLRERFTDYTQQISTLARGVRFLALNAQIAAAQDSSAAALGVLAEATQRISDETLIQTKSFSVSIEGLRNSMDAARQQLEDMLSGGISETEELELGIGAMREAIEILERRLPTAITEIAQRKQQAEELSSDSTEHLKFPELMNQLRADLLPLLGEIGHWGEQCSEGAPLSETAQHKLRELERSYTMAEERASHQQAIHAAVCASTVATVEAPSTSISDSFELFEDFTSMSEPAVAQLEEENLGLNVELF